MLHIRLKIITLEGLKRDETDIRLNNGYGKYLYNKGRFAESEKYFRQAIKSSTWKNLIHMIVNRIII